ncbi:MAG: hypothetical protein JST08_21960 [Actinobacteria bacterium]|nr:hypothetical protein [Actinomycetota bacterium]
MPTHVLAPPEQRQQEAGDRAGPSPASASSPAPTPLLFLGVTRTVIAEFAAHFALSPASPARGGRPTRDEVAKRLPSA